MNKMILQQDINSFPIPIQGEINPDVLDNLVISFKDFNSFFHKDPIDLRDFANTTTPFKIKWECMKEDIQNDVNEVALQFVRDENYLEATKKDIEKIMSKDIEASDSLKKLFIEKDRVSNVFIPDKPLFYSKEELEKSQRYVQRLAVLFNLNKKETLPPEVWLFPRNFTTHLELKKAIEELHSLTKYIINKYIINKHNKGKEVMALDFSSDGTILQVPIETEILVVIGENEYTLDFSPLQKELIEISDISEIIDQGEIYELTCEIKHNNCACKRCSTKWEYYNNTFYSLEDMQILTDTEFFKKVSRNIDVKKKFYKKIQLYIKDRYKREVLRNKYQPQINNIPHWWDRPRFEEPYNKNPRDGVYIIYSDKSSFEEKFNVNSIVEILKDKRDMEWFIDVNGYELNFKTKHTCACKLCNAEFDWKEMYFENEKDMNEFIEKNREYIKEEYYTRDIFYTKAVVQQPANEGLFEGVI